MYRSCLTKNENITKQSDNQKETTDSTNEQSMSSCYYISVSFSLLETTNKRKGFPWGKLTLIGILSGGIGLAAFYVGNPQQFHSYFDTYRDAIESKIR